MVLIAATLWGISGTVAQKLFQHDGVNPGWLTTVRLISSGTLLLLLAGLQTNGNAIWSIWKHSPDRQQLIVFGLFGMVGAQYTYFAAIQAGNAAVATILQYLGPVFIILYVTLRLWRLPDPRQWMVLATALAGTFLLVTNGSFDELSVPVPAVLWGLLCAVTVAFYSMYPKRLLSRWSSSLIVGWAMLIGGIGFSFIHPPWVFHMKHWTLSTGLCLVFIIVFGTLVPFYLYLDSLRYVSPTAASILTSAEPLSALLASIVWFQLTLGVYEGIGAILIVTTVVMLSRTPSHPTEISPDGPIKQADVP
jgi:drug/metabolite transporter (DMT)-like permease